MQEAVDLHREISASAGEAHSLQRMAELARGSGSQRRGTRPAATSAPLSRWSSITLHLLQRIYGTMVRAAPSPAEARSVVAIADAALGQDDFCTFCQVMYTVPAAIACADVGDLETATAHYAVAEAVGAAVARDRVAGRDARGTRPPRRGTRRSGRRHRICSVGRRSSSPAPANPSTRRAAVPVCRLASTLTGGGRNEARRHGPPLTHRHGPRHRALHRAHGRSQPRALRRRHRARISRSGGSSCRAA